MRMATVRQSLREAAADPGLRAFPSELQDLALHLIERSLPLASKSSRVEALRDLPPSFARPVAVAALRR